MKCPKSDFYSKLLTKPFSAGLVSLILLATASSCFASNGLATTETTYVDSVKEWGAWNLDIQPAAGGLQAPSSTQPLTARGTKLRLRTNSFTALAPAGTQGSSGVNPPTPPPPPAVTPPPPPPPVVPPPPTTFAPPGATP